MNLQQTGGGLTFWEHVYELRKRFIRCIIYLFIGTCIGLFVTDHVLGILIKPLSNAKWAKPEKNLGLILKEDGRIVIEPGDKDLFNTGNSSVQRFDLIDEKTGRIITIGPDFRKNFYYFSPIDPFLLWLKASLIVGLIISLVFIMFEVWTFISPGLTFQEKKAAVPVFFGGAILFPTGVVFAFYLIQFALGFFNRYSFPGLEPRIGIMQYLSFALSMMLALGIVFELPVFIVILSWVGIVNSTLLRKYRKHAVVILFILAALVTPPDVMTMMAIGLPLLILYEVSIWLSYMMERKRKMKTEEP